MTTCVRGQILTKWNSRVVFFNEEGTAALELPFIVSIKRNGPWILDCFKAQPSYKKQQKEIATGKIKMQSTAILYFLAYDFQYNLGQNICRLFHVLAQFLFTIRK